MQLCLVNNDPISTLLITPDGEPIFSIETLPLLHPTSQPQPALEPNGKRRADPALDTSSLPSTPLSSSSIARQRSDTTTIKRIERHHRSMGQVETEIGVVEYRGPEIGTHLQLCAQNHALAIAERCTRKQIEARAEEEEVPDEEQGLEDTTYVCIHEATSLPFDYYARPNNIIDDLFLFLFRFAFFLTSIRSSFSCWEFIGPDTRRYRWQVFVHSPVVCIPPSHIISPLIHLFLCDLCRTLALDRR